MSTVSEYGVARPEQIKGKTGLEIMQGILSGELPAPPIAQSMNFKAVEVNEGHVVFEGLTHQNLLNPMGTVHGGWALTLIDTVTGCAAHTTLPSDTMYTTVETKSNFIRPIAHDLGKVRAEGKVLSKGRKIITAEGKIFSEEGKLLAHGTATLIVL